MSAKNTRRMWKAKMVAFLSGFSACAPLYAFDPLLVMPPIIDVSIQLPNDSSRIVCDEVKTIGTRPVSLGEAIYIAICRSPRVRARWSEINVQAAAVGESAAPLLPSITGTLSRINDKTETSTSLGEGSNSGKSNTAYLGLSYRLFDFGARTANLDVNRKLLRAAYISRDAIVQRVIEDVVQGYFDVSNARTLLAAKLRDVELASRTVEVARRREASGSGANYETLQAETALAKILLEKIRAQAELRRASASLMYALGTFEDDIEIKDVEEAPGGNLLTKQFYVQLAHEFHPALLSARAEIESAKRRIDAINAEGKPSLDFNSNFYKNGRPGQSISSVDTKETTVGVSLNIPIFDGFANNYKLVGARAQFEKKESELADTEQQITRDVLKAYADAVSSNDGFDAARVLLTKAQKAMESSARRFKSGIADVVEVLNTQTALIDAEQIYFKSMSDMRSGRLKLTISVGQAGLPGVDWPR
ncbi:TolC family protein [Herbaspirillum seropedicae]|uniref:TolC family protein n=1 Tax=Herbaspirillum seropedicae TaxID=964 RepID=UPI003F8D0A7C